MTRTEPGMTLGPYRLMRRLGSGGMGEVWQARTAEGRDVAVKLLLAHGDDPSDARKFLDEARLGASFDHPNLVRVHDVGAEGGWLFLVMELLHGWPFSRLRDIADGPLPTGMVGELALQALEGLATMHERRAPDGELQPVIHRDIKPSNLFLTDDGTVKIIDFGIALSRGLDRTRTRTGQVRGSLPYSSPEQARGEVPDPRSDLFSMGLVLHELLTGERVFGQENDAAIVTALLWHPIPRASAVRDDIPREFDEAIVWALQRAPALRPASARHLAGRIARAIPPAKRWSRRDLCAWLARAPKPVEDSPPALEARAVPRAPLDDAADPRATQPLPDAPPDGSNDDATGSRVEALPGVAESSLGAVKLPEAGFEDDRPVRERTTSQRAERGSAVPSEEQPRTGVAAAGEARSDSGENELSTEERSREPNQAEVLPRRLAPALRAFALTAALATAVLSGVHPSAPPAQPSPSPPELAPPRALEAAPPRESPSPADLAQAARRDEATGSTAGVPPPQGETTPPAAEVPASTGPTGAPVPGLSSERERSAENGTAASTRPGSAGVRRKPAARATASAWLTVDAQPIYGTVYLDGRQVGVTPLFRLKTVAGRHELEVRRADGAIRRRVVTLAADAEKHVLVEW